MTEPLSYLQLSSSVSPGFWNKLTEVKLDVDKLSETKRHIWGYFNVLSTQEKPFSLMEVDSTSFNSEFNGQNVYLPFQGKMINKNTIEQFKDCDKMDLINDEGRELVEKIEQGEVLLNPSLLNCFFILSFADLKKYHYYYWFAFPVPKGIVIEITKSYPIPDDFTDKVVDDIYNEYKKLEEVQKAYFVLRKIDGNAKIFPLAKIKDLNSENIESYYFVFYNTSFNNSLVGSQLRNYVALILHYCPFLAGKTQKFIAFTLARNGSRITCNHSLIYNLKLPDDGTKDLKTWVGWEKNDRDKMGPRLANMKNTLDPQILAENSVDLNLKLMKWRILPDIDLEKIKTTKCLLLGSGTLGCSVARSLLAWGVRHITFVDNSTVSFSNPVRQSLFTYQDSIAMKPKSVAAADNLRNVFPGVNAQGVQLNIPMPGHSVGLSLLEHTKENVNQLTDLIKSNDVIFLLMDSRESRWLPTLLGSFYNKTVINAALGFDTYLIIRHGSKKEKDQNAKELVHPEGYKTISGSNLGCYFCNDVTAPGNSMKERTLDQQCTVTRPGVSQIAGALAVELAISVLQHNQGSNAPAFYSTSQKPVDLDPEIENQCLLGLLPHSIRGFLSSFNQILPATQKYDHCVACSDMVLREYEEKGMEFLLKVFESSRYLEDVTRLTEMFKDCDFGEVLEFDDEEDF